MSAHDILAISVAVIFFIMGIYFQIYIRKTSENQN